MKYLIILLLAISQAPEPVIDLDAEFLRSIRDSSPQSSLVSVQAIYSNGTPIHKGAISCLGDWYEIAEETVPIKEAPWFRTDSRGVVMFTWYDEAQFTFDCSARSRDGKMGSNQMTIYEFGRYLMKIVVN